MCGTIVSVDSTHRMQRRVPQIISYYEYHNVPVCRFVAEHHELVSTFREHPDILKWLIVNQLGSDSVTTSTSKRVNAHKR